MRFLLFPASVLFLYFTGITAAGAGDSDVTSASLIRVQLQASPESAEVTGRIVIEAADGGLLLEERNRRLRLIPSSEIASRTETGQQFLPMNAQERAQDLLAQAPAGFEVIETDHYLICSDSAEEYVRFCGKLLERVYHEYFEFAEKLGEHVKEPGEKLSVLIFTSETGFTEFAKKQHPETSFDDTPGYYSVRENLTLLMDLTRDRGLRSASAIQKRLSAQPLQVATMVHEAVHQLAFNSGLQVRMADNPVWFSEGLALYFEPLTPASSTLWTAPGKLNGRHHPVFLQAVRTGSPQISLNDLTGSDIAFTDPATVATAYAESWALAAYLFRAEQPGMKKFLTTLASRSPLRQLAPEERIREFRTSFGKSPDEMLTDVVSYKWLRVPKPGK